MVHSEFFDTEEAADKAGDRLARKFGYAYTVSHEMRADGTRDWLLRVYEWKAVA